MKLKLIHNNEFIPELEPQYVLLGMLDEYGERVIDADSDIVDYFNGKEDWVVAGIFVKYLHELAVTLDITTDIQPKTPGKECVSVTSKEMTEYINNLYPHSFDKPSGYLDETGKPLRRAFSHICADMLPAITSRPYKAEEINPRYSYLYGVCLRYRHDGIIRIANALPKVELILEILEQLGCDEVRHKTYLGRVPQVHEIDFSANETLKQFLEQAVQEKAEYII